MKKKVVILVLTVFLFLSVFSQNFNPEMRERIKSEEIAFITQKLNLSPEEAEKFWPVYNKYENKFIEIYKKRKDIHRKFKDLDTMKESDVENNINELIALDQQELDLKKARYAELKNILSIKKIAKLSFAESQFKRMLLMRLKKRGMHERNIEKR